MTTQVLRLTEALPLGDEILQSWAVPLRASSQSGLEDLRSRCRSTPSSKSLPGQ
jgi:hypothetical protein